MKKAGRSRQKTAPKKRVELHPHSDLLQGTARLSRYSNRGGMKGRHHRNYCGMTRLGEGGGRLESRCKQDGEEETVRQKAIISGGKEGKEARMP